MKKILITNSTCLQDNIGGASRSIDEIALELSQFYHITLLVPNRNKKDETENINSNYKIVRYPYNSKNKFTKLFSSIQFFIKNKNLIEDNYDIIWGQSPEPFLYLMVLTKLKKVNNIIYTFHGPWYEEYKYASGKENILLKYIIKFIEKVIIQYAKTIHFQSNYIFQKINQEHKIKKETKILNILINPEQYKNKKYLSTNNFIKSDKLNLFLIRRLTPRTGVLNFVKNIYLLEESLKNEINIIIAGQGEEFKLMEEFIQHNMNSYVRLLGEIEQDMADDLIQKSDYIVMPSIGAEGFGVTVLESLYQGTEVLYANNGGMMEFLNNSYPDNMFEPLEFKSLEKLLKDKIKLNKTNNFQKQFRKVDSSLDFKSNLKKLIDVDYEKKDY